MLWKVAREALVTNFWRHKCNIVDSNASPVCLDGAETVLHVVRDCSIIQQVWNVFAHGSSRLNSFFSTDLHSWLSMNLSGPNVLDDTGWPILFGVVISLAWQSRNELVFNQKRTDAYQIVQKARGQVSAICRSIRDHKLVVPSEVVNLERGGHSLEGA